MTPQEAWDAQRKEAQAQFDAEGEYPATMIPTEIAISPHARILGAGGIAVYNALAVLLHQRQRIETATRQKAPPPTMKEIGGLYGLDRKTVEKYLLILEGYHVIRRIPIIRQNERGSKWMDGYDYILIAPEDWLPADSNLVLGRVVPLDLRNQVFERDNYTCLSCGATDDLTIDHIIPTSRSGQTILKNLQVLCRTCNGKKGDS